MTAMENEHLPEDILHLMARICRSELFWEMQQYMRGEGILLGFLYENPQGCTPKTLAQMMNVSAARITAILGHLECKHLIVRKADVNDKRRIRVQLTLTGMKKVEAIRAQALSGSLQIFERLGAADTKELLRIVGRMLDTEEQLSPVTAGLQAKEGA